MDEQERVTNVDEALTQSPVSQMKPAKTKTENQPVDKKPVFPLERLRRDCFKLLGVTTSTFDGATFGLDGEFTVDGIKKIIENWQNKPILLGAKKKGVK